MTYCCGDGKERFCCPEVPQLVTPTNSSPTPSTDRFNYIPVIIGICVSVIVVLVVVVTALCCLFCSCCPAKKRQRIRKQSSSIALNGTIPICTEAEATSSVIAAEALQLPGRDFAHYPSGRCGVGASGCGASPSPTHDIGRGYGGGGRQWSPTVSSQMDDFDTLFITSLYHHNDTHDLSWHPELQNLCNCSYRPNSNPQPKIRDTNLRFCSSGTSVAFKQSGGSPSALCFDALNAKRSRMTDDAGTPPYLKHPSLELQKQRISPFRLGGIVLPSQGQSQQQQQQQQKSKEPFRFGAGLFSDAERHKRDSGVLVEDQDTCDNNSSPFCVSLASDDQVTTVR